MSLGWTLHKKKPPELLEVEPVIAKQSIYEQLWKGIKHWVRQCLEDLSKWKGEQ